MRTVIVLLSALGVVAFSSRPPHRDVRPSDLRPMLLRPVVARSISKSQLPMLIELYWLRVLNAIGEADSVAKNRALRDYGVVLTDLDPRFYQAYTYIGLNVPFRVGRDDWANADLADDLFRRGLKQFPNDMKLHLYLGFTLFSLQHKYKEAAEVFAAGSKTEGAPPFMAPFATRLLAQAGDARDAVALAKQLAQDTKDDSLREELEGRASDLEVEAQLQEVDQAATRFREREGRSAKDLDELVARGDYTGALTDVKGGQLSLKEDKGYSSSLDRRIEVYE